MKWGKILKIILGITGASGAVLAEKAIDMLMDEHDLYVVASENGCRVFRHECGVELYDFLRRRSSVVRFANDNLFAPIASGTSDADCMIILPCSAATAGRIATGSGNTLLTRAADVMLKERKKLIIGIREAPLSTVTLRNLETLSACGAVICPLVVPFYELPESIDQMYDVTLGRLLLSAGIPNRLISRWNEGAAGI